jgi:hypothetical protein
MSSQEYIRSVSEIVPDDYPTFSEGPSQTSSNSSFMSYFENVSLQTWVIIILILAFLGINIFAYLAKGTQETVSIFSKIFEPILKFFGYSTLTTTKQVVETSATGTKAGVDIVAGATTDAIDTIEKTSQSGPVATSGTSIGVSSNIPQGQMANSSLPVQNNIQQAGSNIDKWQQDSVTKALENSRQSTEHISPDDSRSSIQTTGKSGWCYIGEDEGIRTCSQIGVNDVCMSGDVFPTQSVCVNPNLRV